MNLDQKSWLDEFAVNCRVFKGRWNIRHCLRMCNDIGDLKVRMSTRARGKVTRHESTYNPCRRCKTLAGYLERHREDLPGYVGAGDLSCSEVRAS